MTPAARALLRRSAGRATARQRVADYEVPTGVSRRGCVARSLAGEERAQASERRRMRADG